MDRLSEELRASVAAMRETLYIAYTSAVSFHPSDATSGHAEAPCEPAMLLRMMAKQLHDTGGRSRRAARDAV